VSDSAGGTGVLPDLPAAFNGACFEGKGEETGRKGPKGRGGNRLKGGNGRGSGQGVGIAWPDLYFSQRDAAGGLLLRGRRGDGVGRGEGPLTQIPGSKSCMLTANSLVQIRL